MKRILPFLGALLLSGGILLYHNPSAAQDSDSTAMLLDQEISLEDLMNVPVTVASRNALSLRESPGIITVITDEEIRNMGARDLIDVLRFVPGMEFAQDVQNFVSLGIRGNWASEGKVAVFLDGIAMNEILYATIPFGNHFSVDQIKKIEIIRGPGSAMYGGVAELAVINIITKQSDMNGIQASAMYGQMRNGMGRMSGSLGAGKKFSNGINAYLKTWYSRANRGDGTYYQQDDANQYFNMIGSHEIINFTLDGGLQYKDLEVNFLVDRYNPRQQNGSGYILPYSIDNFFNYYSANIKYNWKISDKLKITPLYQYTYQLPWTSLDSVYSYSYRYLQRHIGRVEASYDPHKNFNLLGGVQFLNDHGNSKAAPYTTYTYNYAPLNASSVNYQNYSAYLQALLKTKIANVTAGARYDKHSLGFDAFVPRVAVTKVINKIHFKALAAQAFRSPYIQNISSDSIRPEKATIFEAEIGYQIGKKMNISLNVFDISIKDALYYVYEENPVTGEVLLDGYYNGRQTGTRGIEAVAKYKDKWGYIDVNYSYYSNAGKNHIAEFAVDRSYFRDPSQAGINTYANRAFAPHKLNVLVNFKITRNLNWNLNANYLSQRFGYDRIQEGDSVLYMQSFPAMFLINTFVNYDNLLIKGLELGIGCYNIADQANPFLMAYTSSVSAMPGPSREFVVRLKYRIGL